MKKRKRKQDELLRLKTKFPKNVLEDLLINNRMTYRDISIEYQENERYLSELAKEYSIKKDNSIMRQRANEWHRIVFAESDIADILDYYVEDKISIRKIAEKYNCNKITIKKLLIDNNIEIRSCFDKNYYGYRKYKSPEISSDGNYLCYDRNRVHRIVYEKYYNIKLSSENHIHHIDFNKLNNNIENLFLFNCNNEHLSYHGYLKGNEYISPEKYMSDVYPNSYGKLINFTKKEWEDLLQQNNNSVNQIHKTNNVSRCFVENMLNKHNIIRIKVVNQYSKCD